MPQVSIITPCYNSDHFIGATIQSVRSQTLIDWEHLVVDDGSTDGSAEIVRGFAEGEPRLRLIQQANRGVSKARNTGFASASKESEFLLFLDSDDCLEPTMLAQLSSYLRLHPQVGLVHCAFFYVDEGDRQITEAQAGMKWSRGYVPTLLGIRRLEPSEPRTPFCSIFALAGLMPSMCLLRRSVFEEVGGFDENFGHIYEETDVYLRVALRSEVHFLPEKLVRYRRHPTQATALGQDDVVALQEKKLYAKWKNTSDLTSEQRSILRYANWFRHQRLGPISGLNAAGRHLRQGQWWLAARFALGAVRRYRAVHPKITEKK